MKMYRRQRKTRKPPFTFVNAGGFWRPELDTPARLSELLELDEALWAASSVPVTGLHFDAATLAFLDADGDGRIRCEELRAAIRWLFTVLVSPPHPDDAGTSLALAEINRETPEGQSVYAAAARVLQNTGRADDAHISLPDVMNRKQVLAAAGSNGDGVVTPESLKDDPALQETVKTIMTTVGSVRDLSGQDGISADQVHAFYEALRHYERWWSQGWSPDTATDPNLTAFAPEALPAAAAAWRAARTGITAWFELSGIVRYDPRAAAAVNARDREWDAMAARDPAALRELLASCPVAPVTGADTLPFDTALNPVSQPVLARFRKQVWIVLFPQQEHGIPEAHWHLTCRLFEAYEQRMQACKGAVAEPLGIERIRALLAERNREPLLDAIRHDAAAAGEIAAISGVEKALRFKRHLLTFANNFAALPHFYDPCRKAAFEMGTLIMDGRRFTLCVHVENQAEHAAVATRAGIYMLYCELSRHDAPAVRRVAVAVTAGGTGALYTGKRGVFRDRDGRNWDARVTAIVANPISLSEAVWAPFKRIGSVITTQIEKLTTTREKHLEREVDAGFTQMSQAVDAGPAGAPPAAAKPAPWGAGGVMVGGSVAVAALGSSFAFISKTFSEIGRINFLYTAAVILLIVLLPTLVLALLRLLARDIGKILEACGWAINGRMRLTMRLARLLSVTPGLPPNARKRNAALDKLATSAPCPPVEGLLDSRCYHE